MLKKASMYLWLLVIAYIVLIVFFGESVAGRTMADNFGTIFFGAVGVQILMLITLPFIQEIAIKGVRVNLNGFDTEKSLN